MRIYERSLFLRLAFTLAITFISIIVMIAWWQMLFHKNLDYYVLSEKKNLEVEILKAIHRDTNQLKELSREKKIIFIKTCNDDICVSSNDKKGFYSISPEYEATLIKEKNRKFRMFVSETSFLIIIIILTIGYMFWVISREKKIQIEKQEFLNMTTHELKHPVSVISLLLESMSRGTLPKERVGEFIQKGMNEVKTLKKSLDNILKLQEISSSPHKNQSLVIINQFLTEMHQKWQLHELNQPNRLNLILHPLKEPEFPVNLGDLMTILNNLIENAFLYSQKEIILSTGQDSLGSYISVRDFGMGFTEEDKENYQKMFFRSRRHNIQNIRGSGLGHFIIKKLILKNSLHLTLESEGENKGSDFKLYFK